LISGIIWVLGQNNDNILFLVGLFHFFVML